MIVMPLPQPIYDPVYYRARIIKLLRSAPVANWTLSEIVRALRGEREKGVTITHHINERLGKMLLTQIELDGVIDSELTGKSTTYFITGRAPHRRGATVPAESVSMPPMRQNTWYGALGIDA